jgi:hypothetical protein
VNHLSTRTRHMRTRSSKRDCNSFALTGSRCAEPRSKYSPAQSDIDRSFSRLQRTI